MASLELMARGPPPHEDVLKIPTPAHQREAIAIIFIFPVISLFVVGARFYVRTVTRTRGLDDYLMALALLFAILLTPPLFMHIKLLYVGWRKEDVPDFDPTAAYWWNFLVQMFYNPVLAFVKASILFFLLRLGGHKTSIRRALIALNIFNAAHAVAVFFTALFQCIPMEANWSAKVKADPDTKCIHNSFHVIASCLSIFTDFLVLILPFWIFLGLNMPWAAKAAVIGIFLVGSVVLIVAIIRVIWIYNLLIRGPLPGQDTYYDISTVYSVVEVNLAIICASVPALRPLFVWWFPKVFAGSSGKPSSNTPYGNSYARGTHGARTLQSNTYDDERSDVQLKDMHTHQTEIRSHSPNGSEEEMLRHNGILITTNVGVAYETNSKHSGHDSRLSNDLK